MDAKGSVDAATVDADEDSVPEKNNFSPRILCIRVSNSTSYPSKVSKIHVLPRT